MKVKEARIKVKLLGPISWTFKREVKESIHGPVMEFDHGTFAFRISFIGEGKMDLNFAGGGYVVFNFFINSND